MDTLRVKKLRPDAILPARATQGSVGYDLCAAVDEPVTVSSGCTVSIPTGIAIELAPGYVGLVFARSGLGIRHGVTPTNAVGVIDSDYRGELQVGLTCHHNDSYIIQPGDRIAQLVVMPVALPIVSEVDRLEDTQRGAGGFGSTGV